MVLLGCGRGQVDGHDEGVNPAAVVIGTLGNRLESEALVQGDGRVIVSAHLEHHGAAPPGACPVDATREQFDGQSLPPCHGSDHDPVKIGDVETVEGGDGRDLVLPGDQREAVVGRRYFLGPGGPGPLPGRVEAGLLNGHDGIEISRAGDSGHRLMPGRVRRVGL